jgi:hypothetical protein
MSNLLLLRSKHFRESFSHRYAELSIRTYVITEHSAPRTNSSHMDRDALPAGYYIGDKLQAGALDFLCVCVK